MQRLSCILCQKEMIIHNCLRWSALMHTGIFGGSIVDRRSCYLLARKKLFARSVNRRDHVRKRKKKREPISSAYCFLIINFTILYAKEKFVYLCGFQASSSSLGYILYILSRVLADEHWVLYTRKRAHEHADDFRSIHNKSFSLRTPSVKVL